MTPDAGHGARQDGRVVPVFAVTGGRTRSKGRNMPIEALVKATELAARQGATLEVEYRSIVDMSIAATSVAEIAAMLRVPVGVARVLVSDLAEAGYLVVHLPQVDNQGRPSLEVLGRLLDGLRAR